MIDAEKASYTVAWTCRLLGMSRSSVYAWRNRAETPTVARRPGGAGRMNRLIDDPLVCDGFAIRIGCH